MSSCAVFWASGLVKTPTQKATSASYYPSVAKISCSIGIWKLQKVSSHNVFLCSARGLPVEFNSKNVTMG